MFKKIQKVALMAAIAGGMAQAHAAGGIDTTAITGGITDAQTAILAVIGALTSLSVAIFGVAKVYTFIRSKSGG